MHCLDELAGMTVCLQRSQVQAALHLSALVVLLVPLREVVETILRVL